MDVSRLVPLALVSSIACGPELPVSAGATESSSGAAETTESSGGSSSTTETTETTGTPCVPEDPSECIADDAMTICIDGTVKEVACADWCGELLSSLGCGVGQETGGDTEGSDLDACRCGVPTEPCDPQMPYVCSSEGQLRFCESDVSFAHDCDEVCILAGYDGATHCGPGEGQDVCFCEISCVQDSMRCDSPHDLATCDAGMWTIRSCADVCGERGFAHAVGCFAAPEQDSDCACF